MYANGPKIVTDGLVLCLDAANRKSYPLSGSTIYDLSGNGNNGTFGPSTSAPTLSGDNGGVLSFDGNDDYVDCGNNLSLSFVNNLTIQVWCSSNISDSGYRSPLMKTTSSAWNDGFGFYQQGGNFYFYVNIWNGAHIVSISKTTFSLTNFVGTYDGANLKIYENGILRSTGTSFTANVSNSSTNLQVGRGGGSDYEWNGNIAQVSIYNRALTAQEIQQNYNALKGRYGLT
jgi:hypothetical protein